MASSMRFFSRNFLARSSCLLTSVIPAVCLCGACLCEAGMRTQRGWVRSSLLDYIPYEKYRQNLPSTVMRNRAPFAFSCAMPLAVLAAAIPHFLLSRHSDEPACGRQAERRGISLLLRLLRPREIPRYARNDSLSFFCRRKLND